MKAHRLDPFVQAIEKLFDDAVSVDEYQRFVRESLEQLSFDRSDPDIRPDWASEIALALENLVSTSFPVDRKPEHNAQPAFALPDPDQAAKWLGHTGGKSVISKGTVQRHTAVQLLSVIEDKRQISPDIARVLNALLRHVELRRNRCLQFRQTESPTERWFEIHDTSILFARAALLLSDLRFLNAALKLNDWAYPVHRRSVPADLLARYVLAVSEVQVAMGALV